MFTLYYIAEVKPAASGGSSGKVQTVEGKWESYRLEAVENRKANIEGTVAVKDENGKSVIVSRLNLGRWQDMPKGWAGKGNRSNPIIPYRTVAADQKIHPFGSRIFIPELKGYKTPGGEKLDGYFWVADSGGGIKGRYRFDIFVGNQPEYLAIMEEGEGKWQVAVEVERLPKVPAKFNPTTDKGVLNILKGLGYDLPEKGPTPKLLPPVPGKNASTDSKAVKALTDFQKKHPDIPEQEYRARNGAITLWYLAKAALAVSKGEDYAATPGKGTNP